jgi:hypothetical protein
MIVIVACVSGATHVRIALSFLDIRLLRHVGRLHRGMEQGAQRLVGAASASWL